MTKTEAAGRIKKLRQEINHHRYLYHVFDKAEISEAAVDSLKHELWQLEQLYPDLITPDSPTQRVGGQPLPNFKKVKHASAILSIEDAFDLSEVSAWEERNRKLLSAPVKGYYGELKMDGLAMVLTYANGLFIRGVTRGDGLVGEDVTANLKTIESIPLRLETGREAPPARLDVRGEVVITLNELKRINAKQAARGLPLFANPRNLAAGTIRQLDARVAAERRLDFYAFEILTDIGQKTHAEVHQQLRRFGFKTNPHSVELDNLEAAAEYLKTWQTKRASLPYQTDGVVLVVNDMLQQRILGSVGKADRWMLAFKFPAQQATTRVKDIVVQVGRTGALTPVAILEPVLVAGTTVSRATLHNQDEIKRLDVRLRDTVIIQKAGDIIPDVVKVLFNLRTGQEKPFILPRTCPACGSKTERRPGEVAWYCSNKQCFARQREQMYHFVSRSAFAVDGLGPSIIDQLLDSGLIKDAADLFTLTAGDLEPLPGFAAKSADKLVAALAAAKKINLARFINALGIRHVGIETALLLAQRFGSLNKLMKATPVELAAVDGVGEVVAGSFYDFFHNVKNQKLVAKLLDLDVKIATVAKPVGKLTGQSLVLTGTLAKLTREQAQAAIRAAGGNVSESVSRQTSYVVAGEKPGNKFTKAKELGVKVIDEAEFRKLLEL